MTISNILIDLRVNSLEDAIRKLINESDINNKDEAVKAVLEREKLQSTYIGKGIQIPHAKLNSMDDLVTMLGISKEGILIGENKVNIVIITLSSKDKSGPHVRFLSEIISILESDNLREEILRANTNLEVEEILRTL